MSALGFLQTRQWVIGRRVALILLVFVLGYRSYGGGIFSWFRSGDEGGVIVTKSEFRADLDGTKPAWIIGLRNNTQTTYDRIELEATYLDATGKVLEQDKLVVRKRLTPGQEELIGAVDVKDRPGASAGSLKVIRASSGANP